MPWLEIAFAVGCIALVCQIFPGTAWELISILDVRGWGWRSYSACCALAIVTLVAFKAWTDRDT